MSNFLVQKSLELLGYEDDVKKGKKKKRTKYKGALDLIPPKHRVISKQKKTDLATVLKRPKSLTVHEAKKKIAAREDLTDANIQKLFLLSTNSISPDIAEKLFNRAVKKDYVKKEKSKEPETTAFTEEDFKKFEQEYIG